MAILIVDDEEAVRRALRRVLQRHHAVDDVATVQEARRALAGAPFELVLCDVTLAGESGLELVRSLSGEAPATVVVMVTGLDDPRIAEQALALGVYGYLVKPFTPNEILITVATALRRRALELERTKVEQQASELRLLDDRERIGRDLHDNVIQRLFAVGMTLQSANNFVTDASASDKIERAVDELDAVIRTIRTVIFNVESGRPASLRASVIDLVRETTQTVDLEPTVEFSGAIDTLVDANTADQLLATLREALSNVARHAGAERVEVDVTVDRDLSLTVRDDGVGVGSAGGAAAGGLGMTNMRSRAERLGGRMTVERRSVGGTQLEWRIPLEDR